MSEIPTRLNAAATLEQFTEKSRRHSLGLPLLHWKRQWSESGGAGVTIGLLDTGFDRNFPDIKSPTITSRDFIPSMQQSTENLEHGTYSVLMLAGQGKKIIRGIAPLSHLLVAVVVDAMGVASPKRVSEGIEWLISKGAQVVAIPLGEPTVHSEISDLIQKGSNDGVIFCAAAGNHHPHPILFPASHPLTIAVGASDSLGSLLPDCCRVPRLDLVAPGLINIPDTSCPKIIRYPSGSSVACVLVAGTVALALSSGIISTDTLTRGSVLEALTGGRGSRRHGSGPSC